jgi:MFS family permease
MTATFSAQLVGIYAISAVFGGSIMAIILKAYPVVWKSNSKQILLLAQLVRLVGSCVFSWVSTQVIHTAVHTADESHILSLGLVISRVMSGLVQGFCAQLLQVSFAHLTPLIDRPSQMVRFSYTNILGIGLGPMIVATMRILHVCPSEKHPGSVIIGLSQLALSLAPTVAVAMYYPRLDDVDDFMETESFEAQVASRSSTTLVLQKVVLIGCMIDTFLCALVTSAVEGATPLLLETEYGWHPNHIGIIIGAVILCCYPARTFIDLFKRRLNAFQWIKLFCCISIVGSSFLFRRDWRCLIMADILLYPSLYLKNGMVTGLMQQYALPSGSKLDQNLTTFWAMLITSLGRYIGPCIARSLLDRGNQNSYAMLQLFYMGVFWIVFELMVVKSIQSKDMQLLETPARQWWQQFQKYHDKLKWSQSLEGVTVEIDVDVCNTSDLEVTFKSRSISVKRNGEILLEGTLHDKIIRKSSTWRLEEGRQIVLSMDKGMATSWEHLLANQ